MPKTREQILEEIKILKTYDEKLKKYEEFVKNEPQNLEVWLVKGEFHINMARYGDQRSASVKKNCLEAVECFKKVTDSAEEKGSDDLAVNGWRGMGHACFGLENYVKAAQCYQFALNKIPEDAKHEDRQSIQNEISNARSQRRWQVAGRASAFLASSAGAAAAYVALAIFAIGTAPFSWPVFLVGAVGLLVGAAAYFGARSLMKNFDLSAPAAAAFIVAAIAFPFAFMALAIERSTRPGAEPALSSFPMAPVAGDRVKVADLKTRLSESQNSSKKIASTPMFKHGQDQMKVLTRADVIEPKEEKRGEQKTEPGQGGDILKK